MISSMLYLAYEGEHTIRGGPALTPTGSFGRKMSVNDLIARQMCVSRQEKSHCNSVSFDRNCANAFHHYDLKEVDNDFFLVVVKILDHQGSLPSTFPIEN
ncbi:hypothetical protein HID58_071711 [Brassica napus]|uniref:Uncharacterized protein n=1 Tax=Brassica napus TaxID=3708 RepID=A0ABQ7Z2D9_BRANA|nr:hypothetical protein HID58_071711 [Brassica napus]